MEVQYPLVFFTLFLCLTAGVLTFQGWMLFKGTGTRRFHEVALIVELVALVAGGISSFLHLHHWERIFNGFGHLTSGITQELIGIVVTFIVMVIIFVMLRKSTATAENGEHLVPKWVGILALVVGIAMGFVCAHSYFMVSRPAWSNFTLYLFYYSSEFILGAVGIWMVAAATKQDDAVTGQLARLSFIAGLASAAVILICGFYYTTISFYDVGIAFHTTNPTAPAADPTGTLASPIMGSQALLFWGGAIVVGSLVAAVLGFLKWRKPQGALPYAVISLVCALAGGICFRIVLYAVGVAYYVYF